MKSSLLENTCEQFAMGNWQRAMCNRQFAIGNGQNVFKYLLIACCKLPIIACLLLIANYTNAQTPITLEKATQIALDNNLKIKNRELRAKYREKLTHSAKLFQPTNFNAEYGQFNSMYKDKAIGISQTFNFPTVYAANKKLLNAEWESSVLQTGIEKAELKRQVAKTYFLLSYLMQKEKLLQQNDSLYAKFLEKATNRFKAGESNVLEKTTAENLRGQIALQLSALQNDRKIALLRFQLLLNTDTAYIPIEQEINTPILLDSVSLKAHPALQYLEQQKQVTQATIKAQKSQRWPDITFGYNVQGMKGIGPDNTVYENDLRLQYFQVGLNVPLFGTGLKAKIQAAKAGQEMAENAYETKMKTLETAFQSALSEYKKFNKEVLYYQNTGLANAETIASTADKQFLGGNINYLDWVLLMNQAIEIQSNYLEALKNRNVSRAGLEYFYNK